PALPPLIMCDSPVNTVESFRFLGTIMAKDLRWAENITSTIKKAQQRMFFLRRLKKFNMPQKVMIEFYTAIIESILTSSINIWFAAAHCKGQGQTGADHSVSREGHRLRPAVSPRPVPLQDQQEDMQDHRVSFPPRPPPTHNT